MIDEHKLLRDADRAAQAQALLDNPLLNQAYDATDAQLVADWRATEPNDSAARELIWHAMQANAEHKRWLQRALNDGKLAAVELRQLTEANERKKKYGVL